MSMMTEVLILTCTCFTSGSWFQQPYDCYYQNPTPDWGQQGNPDDDLLLDLDDIDGGGPENIGLSNPENTQNLGNLYIVGVHYNRSRDRVDGDLTTARALPPYASSFGGTCLGLEQEDGTAAKSGWRPRSLLGRRSNQLARCHGDRPRFLSNRTTVD